MKMFSLLTFFSVILNFCLISATEFTISSYNCGGLSDHYDYLRAASMEKLMQERYIAEPEKMSLNEKIQKVALKILFAPALSDHAFFAEMEWDRKGYQNHFECLTAAPIEAGSLNNEWNKKADGMITSYQVRPVLIHDENVNHRLQEHLMDLSQSEGLSRSEQLQVTRKKMAKRIFAHHLNYDIICLQEADYLDASLFPQNYDVLFAETSHSKNGIAWNTDRFELVKPIGNILGRAFAVCLKEKESGKTVLVASGHITGCNPYRIEKNPKTGISDSAKGDSEIQTVINLFDRQEADLMMIGMDSNVTSLHPRLRILKDAGYQLDYENHLEPTCTNPYQVLNTRIDWIAFKSTSLQASITNIPVLSVGLNNIQTNISDHKPIAAKIKF